MTSTDIVDETAAVAERLRRDAYAPHFTSVGAANLMIEAADLIERLSRERDTVIEECIAVVGKPRTIDAMRGDVAVPDCAQDIIADLRALQGQPRERGTGVPEGWQLVPKEPTKEMITFGRQVAVSVSTIYYAMLSAAPQPPTVSTQGDMLIPMGRENDGDKHVTAYMCLIDFECELGLASGGNRVYPSIEDIREHSKCVGGCGIVEVEVRATRVVQEPSDEGELVMTAAEIEAAEHSPPSPQPDLSTLTRERDQAREALAPFAKVLDAMEHDNQLCEEEIDSVLAGTGIVPSDLRRARSVLQSEKEDNS